MRESTSIAARRCVRPETGPAAVGCGAESRWEARAFSTDSSLRVSDGGHAQLWKAQCARGNGSACPKERGFSFSGRSVGRAAMHAATEGRVGSGRRHPRTASTAASHSAWRTRSATSARQVIRYSRPANADAASTSLSPLGEGSSPDGAATPAPGPSDDSERVAEATEPEGSTDSADRGATPDTDEGPPRDTRTRRRRGGTDGDGAPACIGKESSAGGVAAPPMDSATSTEPFCEGDVFALGVDPNALLCGGAPVPSATERSITGGEPGVGPAEA